MKATEIFGNQLRPMMEFVGWITDLPLDELSYLAFVNKSSSHQTYRLIEEAHTFLSQPMEGDAKKLKHFINSLFKGEWDVQLDPKSTLLANDYYRYILNGECVAVLENGAVINAFATRCLDQGIPLELNEEYEIPTPYELKQQAKELKERLRDKL
ncbi:hypothetical protein [Ekhidna sp.]